MSLTILKHSLSDDGELEGTEQRLNQLLLFFFPAEKAKQDEIQLISWWEIFAKNDLKMLMWMHV